MHIAAERFGIYQILGEGAAIGLLAIYRIATYMEICGGRIERSGYRLYHKRIPLDDYGTLEAAQDMAMAHWASTAHRGGSIVPPGLTF